MAKIEFLNQAVTDLDDIDDYSVAMFGEDTATRYMRGFEEAFALLQRHPLAGPASPELGREMRCLVHRKHRILYSVSGDAVLIIRIIHHARDAKLALN